MFNSAWGVPDKDKAALKKRIKELGEFFDAVTPRIQAGYDGTLKVVEFAPHKIAHYYWWALTTYVRPLLAADAKANRYKIASLLELCIARVKPFRHTDKATESRVNAQFGMIAAITVIEGFAKTTRISRPPDTDKSELANAIRWSLDDHEDVMFLKNDNVSPFLLNSGYWHALDWLCVAYRSEGK